MHDALALLLFAFGVACLAILVVGLAIVRAVARALNASTVLSVPSASDPAGAVRSGPVDERVTSPGLEHAYSRPDAALCDAHGIADCPGCFHALESLYGPRGRRPS